MKRTALISLLFATIFLCAQTKQQSPPTIVKAARLLDVKSGKYIEDPAVLVRGGDIEELGGESARSNCHRSGAGNVASRTH
jgi:imidazolonepropionase-like amidohydrolase